MTENLAIWKKLSKPPLSALKEIKGGRLAGKHDINPTWRMQAVTELFGPCGIGWKYTIDRIWTEPGTEGQVCAFAIVSVYIKSGEVWSEAIPGTGGSMLIAKEKAGPYTSDEAFKMATTDALSVAFKALGVAAEIYLGNFDGSKYASDPSSGNGYISPEQAKAIHDLLTETQSDLMKFLVYAKTDAVERIAAADFQKLHAALLRKKAEVKA